MRTYIFTCFYVFWDILSPKRTSHFINTEIYLFSTKMSQAQVVNPLQTYKPELSLYCNYCLKEKHIREYLLFPVSSHLYKNQRCVECYQNNKTKSIKKCLACFLIKSITDFPTLKSFRCKDCIQNKCKCKYDKK